MLDYMDILAIAVKECLGFSGNDVSQVVNSLPGALPHRPVLAPERQRQIRELLRERGSVHAGELAGIFGVTHETIRRDLARLEEAGLLTRAHGGAVADADGEATFRQRLGINEREKMAIGRAAAELVRDGSRILLDSGTTTLALARSLQGRRDLLVVTNAVTHAGELMNRRDVTVVMTGGVVRRSTYGAIGDLAVDALRQLHVDQVFLAIHSVSAAAGLTYPAFEEIAAKRAMVAAGTEIILLADATKIGRTSLLQVVPITSVHRIITSGSVDAEEAARIRDLGVDLIVVPPDRGS
jgi:DeoR/GlpR family transcriptional regulator of sugar metabolism